MAGAFLFAAIPGLARQSSEIRLPTDPKTPVITFDWRGGLALQPRIKSEPVLTIRANGTITVVDPFSNVADISGALTAEELQDLLKFMVKDHDVFGIREQEIGAAIEAEMKRMGRFFGVSDASDTKPVSMP
jgi:hypothetical protein